MSLVLYLFPSTLAMNILIVFWAFWQRFVIIWCLGALYYVLYVQGVFVCVLGKVS